MAVYQVIDIVKKKNTLVLKGNDGNLYIYKLDESKAKLSYRIGETIVLEDKGEK